jgi:hypothetical protein
VDEVHVGDGQLEGEGLVEIVDDPWADRLHERPPVSETPTMVSGQRAAELHLGSARHERQPPAVRRKT